MVNHLNCILKHHSVITTYNPLISGLQIQKENSKCELKVKNNAGFQIL